MVGGWVRLADAPALPVRCFLIEYALRLAVVGGIALGVGVTRVSAQLGQRVRRGRAVDDDATRGGERGLGPFRLRRDDASAPRVHQDHLPADEAGGRRIVLVVLRHGLIRAEGVQDRVAHNKVGGEAHHEEPPNSERLDNLL
eukprot:5260412-Prymnesium_polylepis.2